MDGKAIDTRIRNAQKAARLNSTDFKHLWKGVLNFFKRVDEEAVKRIKANFASMVLNQVRPCLVHLLNQRFEICGFPEKKAVKLARAVAREILGLRGKVIVKKGEGEGKGEEEEEEEGEGEEEEEEEEEEEGEEEEEESEDGSVLLTMPPPIPDFAERITKLGKGARSGLKRFLADLAMRSHTSLYDLYMPDTLKMIIPANHAGYGPLLQKAAKKKPGRVISFFKTVDEQKFVQALFPQPNVEASKLLMTTTILAHVLVSFLKTRVTSSTERHDIIKSLQNQAMEVQDFLVTLFPYMGYQTIPSFENAQQLESYQLTLLPCIFPGILKIALFGSLDGAVRGNGEFPGEDSFHLMWSGSVYTDSRSWYAIFFDSSKPTKRTSKLAKEQNLDERPYAYDNLLSVSNRSS